MWVAQSSWLVDLCCVLSKAEQYWYLLRKQQEVFPGHMVQKGSSCSGNHFVQSVPVGTRGRGWGLCGVLLVVVGWLIGWAFFFIFPFHSMVSHLIMGCRLDK